MTIENSGTPREALIAELGMTTDSWKTHLGILGIKDKPLFDDNEAGIIRTSAASIPTDGTTPAQSVAKASNKGKGKGKTTKIVQKVQQSVQAYDANAVDTALAQTATEAEAMGTNLASQHLQLVSGSYVATMGEGLTRFASQSANFLSMMRQSFDSVADGEDADSSDPFAGMENLFQQSLGEP